MNTQYILGLRYNTEDPTKPVFVGDIKAYLRIQMEKFNDTKYHVRVSIDKKNILLEEYDLEK